jgi:hypothetical protein
MALAAWLSQVWGADACILHSAALRSKQCARAITFVECVCINENDINAILPQFPAYQHELRKRIVRLAVRRAFVAAAEERKAGKAKRPPTPADASSIDLSQTMSGSEVPSFADISEAAAQQYHRPPGDPASEKMDALAATLVEGLAQLQAATAKLTQQVAPLPAAIEALAHEQKLLRREMGVLQQNGDARGLEDASSTHKDTALHTVG